MQTLIFEILFLIEKLITFVDFSLFLVLNRIKEVSV